MTPREIDALVAEKIFGLKVIGLRRVHYLHDGGALVLEADDAPMEGERMEPCTSSPVTPNYSTQEPCEHYSSTGDGMLSILQVIRTKWIFSARMKFARELEKAAEVEPGVFIKWPDAVIHLTPEKVAVAALRALGVEVNP